MVVLTAAAKSAGLPAPFKGDDAGAIGGKCQVAKFQHHIQPHGPIVRILWLAIYLQALRGYIRAGNIYPDLLPFYPRFSFSYAGKVFVQADSVGFTKIFLQRKRIPGDSIQNAALFGVALKGRRSGCCIIRHKQPLKQPPRAVLCREWRTVLVKGKGVAV